MIATDCTILVVARSPYCKHPGPEVEVSGTEVVIIRWKCPCGLRHEYRSKN